MWLMFVAVALAGKPWLTENSDITADRTVAAPPEVIYDTLLDLRVLDTLTPEGCVTDFQPGSTTKGPGGSAFLKYNAGPLHRRLEAFVDQTREYTLIDLDHPGPKGFVTRFELEPAGEGTHVAVTTYMNPPPWPFKKVYFTRVRPAWTQCYLDMLKNLDEQTQP